MKKTKRTKMKIGELTIQTPTRFITKYIWAYFEKNYWTDNKLMCVLNINFKKDEFERLDMFMDRLYSLDIKGVEVTAHDVNLGLYNKGTKEPFHKKYFKVFLNVDLSKTNLSYVLKILNESILVSVTRYLLEIDEKRIEPLKEKTMVDMI